MACETASIGLTGFPADSLIVLYKQSGQRTLEECSEIELVAELE